MTCGSSDPSRLHRLRFRKKKSAAEPAVKLGCLVGVCVQNLMKIDRVSFNSVQELDS